jgi:hypothetical protein
MRGRAAAATMQRAGGASPREQPQWPAINCNRGSACLVQVRPAIAQDDDLDDLTKLLEDCGTRARKGGA